MTDEQRSLPMPDDFPSADAVGGEQVRLGLWHAVMMNIERTGRRPKSYAMYSAGVNREKGYAWSVVVATYEAGPDNYFASRRKVK